LIGNYDLFINVQGDGRTAASDQRSITLGEERGTVSVDFDFEWALKEAEPLAAGASLAAISHSFTGKSIVSSGSPDCIGSIPLVDSSTLTFSAEGESAEGENVQLVFDNFYGKVLRLSGTAAEGPDGALSASGTYESSDAKSGSWTINRLAAPTPRVIGALVELQNDTDSCQATYEFAGVR